MTTDPTRRFGQWDADKAAALGARARSIAAKATGVTRFTMQTFVDVDVDHGNRKVTATIDYAILDADLIVEDDGEDPDETIVAEALAALAANTTPYSCTVDLPEPAELTELRAAVTDAITYARSHTGQSSDFATILLAALTEAGYEIHKTHPDH